MDVIESFNTYEDGCEYNDDSEDDDTYKKKRVDKVIVVA